MHLQMHPQLADASPTIYMSIYIKHYCARPSAQPNHVNNTDNAASTVPYHQERLISKANRSTVCRVSRVG